MKKRFIQCRAELKSGSVKKYGNTIVVSASTLPDNVVMNGLLYPPSENERSYTGLSGAPAPLNHPVNAEGLFVSAHDAEAESFNVGATNQNPVRVNGRVNHDIVIDTLKASETEGGRRLIDAVNKMTKPIHTSVGVWCEVEDLPTPRVNSSGERYSGVVRNMVIDHNAILLDEEGAATPDKGVGMAVNKAGDKVKVLTVNCNDQYKKDSSVELRELLISKLKDSGVDVKDGADDESICALVASSLKSDEEIEDDPDEVKAGSIDTAMIANAVAEAIKPISDELNSLKSGLGADADAKRESIIDIIVNSGQYPELDKESLGLLPLDCISKMADGCGGSFGVPAGGFIGNSAEKTYTSVDAKDLPE